MKVIPPKTSGKIAVSRNTIVGLAVLTIVLALAILYGFFGNAIFGLEKAQPQIDLQ